MKTFWQISNTELVALKLINIVYFRKKCLHHGNSCLFVWSVPFWSDTWLCKGPSKKSLLGLCSWEEKVLLIHFTPITHAFFLFLSGSVGHPPCMSGVCCVFCITPVWCMGLWGRRRRRLDSRRWKPSREESWKGRRVFFEKPETLSKQLSFLSFPLPTKKAIHMHKLNLYAKVKSRKSLSLQNHPGRGFSLSEKDLGCHFQKYKRDEKELKGLTICYFPANAFLS